MDDDGRNVSRTRQTLSKVCQEADERHEKIRSEDNIQRISQKKLHPR